MLERGRQESANDPNNRPDGQAPDPKVIQEMAEKYGKGRERPRR